MPAVTVLSIARPLLEELAARPFVGRVLGRFERALNLVDKEGRVIVVTLPEIGKGPFSILVAGNPGFFRELAVGQPALADRHSLVVGGWHLDWRTAETWEPRLACPTQPLHLNSAIVRVLKPYTDWPHLGDVNATLSHRLVQAATGLSQALVDGKANTEQVARAASLLAGLGSGLTPAGDDYLVGVMVALWLGGFKPLLTEIAGAAIPQTTALSAAFLRAAAQGEFVEPWHGLAQSLCAGEAESLSRAAARVAQFGASSGRDALAGFAITMLSNGNRANW